MTSIPYKKITLPDNVRDEIYGRLKIISDSIDKLQYFLPPPKLTHSTMFGWIEDPKNRRVRDIITQTSKAILDEALPEDIKQCVNTLLKDGGEMPILLENTPTDKIVLSKKEQSPVLTTDGHVDSIFSLGFGALFSVSPESCGATSHDVVPKIDEGNPNDRYYKTYRHDGIPPHNDISGFPDNFHTVHCVKGNAKAQTSWRPLSKILSRLDGQILKNLKREEFEQRGRPKGMPVLVTVPGDPPMMILDWRTKGKTNRAKKALTELNRAIEAVEPVVFNLQRGDFLILPEIRGLHEVSSYDVSKTDDARWVDIVVGQSTHYKPPYSATLIERGLHILTDSDPREKSGRFATFLKSAGIMQQMQL